MLASVLQAAGLPARIALLRVGSWEDVRETLPSLNVFDHAIVVVTGDQPLWIDPTSDHSWAGELPPGDQNRLALIIDEDTKRLTRTPNSSVTNNTYREVREILQRLLEARPGTNPDSVDWFVIGLLADQLALTAVARDAYLRVERPPNAWPTSTYTLTQKRLAKLNKD